MSDRDQVSNSYPYESWMFDIQSHIRGKKMCELCIPGTHDSGSYNLKASIAIAQIGENWANTQSRSIAEQLKSGIRLFDLRLMYTGPAGSPFTGLGDVRITHSYDEKYPSFTTFIGKPVAEELEAMESFLRGHSQEILFIQIHQTLLFRESGVGDAVHAAVCARLAELFADIAIPYGERSKTVGELLHGTNRGRVVILYEGLPEPLRQQYPYLWTSAWPDNWVNTLSVLGLFNSTNQFMYDHKDRAGDNFYNAPLTLTGTVPAVVWDIATRPWVVALIGALAGLLVPVPFAIMAVIGAVLGAVLGAILHSQERIDSILAMAKTTNPLAYSWLRFIWPLQANFVSVDYFEEGGDLLDIVKEINTGRFIVPPTKIPLTSGRDIELYAQSKKYIAPFHKEYNATARRDVCYPALHWGNAIKLRVLKVRGDAYVRDGDRVFIETLEDKVEPGKRLGAWSTPALYYWSDDYPANETWTIRKADPSNDVICLYDWVTFTNEAHPDHMLMPTTDGNWLTRSKEGRPFYWWVRV